MSRVQSTGVATPINLSAPGQEEPEAASARGRRFEPPVPDRIDLDELQPGGAPGRAGATNVETGHLTFHGGKVLRSPDVVPVYVGAYWQTLDGKRDLARNDAAMRALVKDPGQTGIWKEYGGGPGTTSPSKVLAWIHPARVLEGGRRGARAGAGSGRSVRRLGSRAHLHARAPARSDAARRRGELDRRARGLPRERGREGRTPGLLRGGRLLAAGERTGERDRLHRQPGGQRHHHREPRDHRGGDRPRRGAGHPDGGSRMPSGGTTTRRRCGGATGRPCSTRSAGPCAARARSATSPCSTRSWRATRR